LSVLLEFGTGAHKDVAGKIDAAETTNGSLHSLYRTLIGLWNYKEKVDVAAFGWSAPSMGAEEIDAVRLELANEPIYSVRYFSRKIFGHGRNLAGVIGQIEYNFCTGQMGKG
jgi:hypothetical protein